MRLEYLLEAKQPLVRLVQHREGRPVQKVPDHVSDGLRGKAGRWLRDATRFACLRVCHCVTARLSYLGHGLLRGVEANDAAPRVLLHLGVDLQVRHLHRLADGLHDAGRGGGPRADDGCHSLAYGTAHCGTRSVFREAVVRRTRDVRLLGSGLPRFPVLKLSAWDRFSSIRDRFTPGSSSWSALMY